MFRLQPDLFVQLSVHGLLGGFAELDPPLRELPGMLLYSFTQNTSLRSLSRMMPTFGRYPSLSSMPSPEAISSATDYMARCSGVKTE